MTNKYRLIYSGIAGVLITLTLSSCAKTIDCGAKGEHVHLYVDRETHLSIYKDSEKDKIENFTKGTYANMVLQKLVIILHIFKML